MVVAARLDHQRKERIMTAKTTIGFDLDTYKRAFEEWDIETILDLYAEDVELVQIDRDNPPSSPRVRQGKEVFRGMFEHCAAAGVKGSVENGVADENRAAITVTCDFPGGRKVVANGILELEGGRIVRELDVTSGDPK
jgi:ketosteroid isomerase-like protein